jgi:hypothetical protein
MEIVKVYMMIKKREIEEEPMKLKDNINVNTVKNLMGKIKLKLNLI